MQVTENIARLKEFDATINARFKEENLVLDGSKANPEAWKDFVDGDKDFEEEFQNVINDKSVTEADDEFNPDAYDTYVNMELALECGDGQPTSAKVTKRMKNKDGLPTGMANDNPILDTRVYEVEYQDGYKTSLAAANMIAENLFAQVDQEDNRHVLLSEIVEHCTARMAQNSGKKMHSLSTSMGTRDDERPRRPGKCQSNGRTAAILGLHSRI